MGDKMMLTQASKKYASSYYQDALDFQYMFYLLSKKLANLDVTPSLKIKIVVEFRMACECAIKAIYVLLKFHGEPSEEKIKAALTSRNFGHKIKAFIDEIKCMMKPCPGLLSDFEGIDEVLSRLPIGVSNLVDVHHRYSVEITETDKVDLVGLFDVLNEDDRGLTVLVGMASSYLCLTEQINQGLYPIRLSFSGVDYAKQKQSILSGWQESKG